MEEELISFKTAKLAKEKGYSIGGFTSFIKYRKTYVYDSDPNHPESYKKGEIRFNDNFFHINGPLETCSKYYTLYERPTQSLLQKWLRKTNKILVEVIAVDDWDHWIYSVTTEGMMCPFDETPWNGEEYSTYEEALEAGLQESFKYIKNK